MLNSQILMPTSSSDTYRALCGDEKCEAGSRLMPGRGFIIPGQPAIQGGLGRVKKHFHFIFILNRVNSFSGNGCRG